MSLSQQDTRIPVKNPTTGLSIKLFPYQITHHEESLVILRKYKALLNLAPLGSGKTPCTIALAIVLDLPLFVVCPKGAVAMWRKMAAELRVPVVAALSYGGLRSKKGTKKLSHPWLERVDKKAEGSRRTITRFKPTAAMIEACAKGMLIVFDEMHVVRGASGQTAACHGLMQAVHSPGMATGKSKVVALSGTPATDPVEVCRHLRFLGVYTDEKLSKTVFGKFCLLGGKDVIRAAFSMDSDKTKDIVQKAGQLKKTTQVVDLCYTLYQHIFRKEFVSTMTMVPGQATLKVANAIFKMDAFPEEKRAYNRALAQLKHDAFHEDEHGNWVPNKGFQGGSVFKLHHAMEDALVRSIVADALREYEVDPRIKLCFSFNYDSSLELAATLLKEALGDEQVGVIKGSTPSENDRNPSGVPTREAIVARFQVPYATDKMNQPEDDEEDEEETFSEEEDEEKPVKASLRPDAPKGPKPLIALVGNLKCIGASLSLDDTRGDCPRVAYCAASTDVLNTTQFTGRFRRANTVGVATVKLCHGYGLTGESLPMLDSLSKRSQVLAALLPEQVEQGMLFPGQYPVEVIGG